MVDANEARYYKAKYHEAAIKNMDAGHPYGQFSMEMTHALKDMADRDIWPDCHFGDIECNAWSLFYRPREGS